MARRQQAAASNPTAGRARGGLLAGWSDSFQADLARVTSAPKLKKALEMLRGERFQLFAEVEPTHVLGVVRSQSASGRVYACRLAEDGFYGCCTQNLITCVVSRDSPCKHLLVLVLGLVRSGQLDAATAIHWLGQTRRDKSTPDKEETTAIFLRYKGVQAGEVDWRPTETIPEDFYAI